MIELSKTEFNELNEVFSKFLPELDHELLFEMDKYVKTNMPDKSITDIKLEEFKVSEMKFKNPKFKKLNETVKKKRMELNFGLLGNFKE